MGVAAWKWETFLGKEALDSGVRMTVSSLIRMHPNVGMTRAKISGQYVNSIIAKTTAVRAGFDEAIMLDPEGFVVGCTGENLLLVRDGVIFTPPKATILEGVTQNAVIELAQDAGYTVVEEQIRHDQLHLADEILVCGTAAEVVGVCEVDHRPIGNGKVGPVTHHLQEQLFR